MSEELTASTFYAQSPLSPFPSGRIQRRCEQGEVCLHSEEPRSNFTKHDANIKVRTSVHVHLGSAAECQAP